VRTLESSFFWCGTNSSAISVYTKQRYFSKQLIKMSAQTVAALKRKFAEYDELLKQQKLGKRTSANDALGYLAKLPVEVRAMIFGLLIPAAGSLSPNHDPALVKPNTVTNHGLRGLKETRQAQTPSNNNLSALRQTCRAINDEIALLPVYKSREYSLTITEHGVSFEGIMSRVANCSCGSLALKCARVDLLHDFRAIQALRNNLSSIQRLCINFRNASEESCFRTLPFKYMDRICTESSIDDAIQSGFKSGVAVAAHAEWRGRISDSWKTWLRMADESVWTGVVGGPLLKESFLGYWDDGEKGAREVGVEEWAEMYGRHHLPSYDELSLPEPDVGEIWKRPRVRSRQAVTRRGSSTPPGWSNRTRI
jgi:hypothetical protein